nr:ribose 5-phosphate isomerase B [Clostridia bacterium]
MSKKTIAIGCDHGGYELKLSIIKRLEKHSDRYEIIDCGAYTPERSEYPEIAHKLCETITSGNAECGILVCGTGLGMSMAANKHPGIRAACVSDTFSARLTREHNDANVLCLGGRVVGPGLADDIVALFLETPFSGGERHVARVAAVMEFDKK